MDPSASMVRNTTFRSAYREFSERDVVRVI
jgi:hypothetical protein